MPCLCARLRAPPVLKHWLAPRPARFEVDRVPIDGRLPHVLTRRSVARPPTARNTRRCPARGRALTSPTARRVVRSPPVKPTATRRRCTTCVRGPARFDRAASSSILSSLDQPDPVLWATGDCPASRNATNRPTVGVATPGQLGRATV